MYSNDSTVLASSSYRSIIIELSTKTTLRWSSPILIKAYLATTFQPFKSTSTIVTVWNNNQHNRQADRFHLERNLKRAEQGRRNEVSASAIVAHSCWAHHTASGKLRVRRRESSQQAETSRTWAHISFDWRRAHRGASRTHGKAGYVGERGKGAQNAITHRG